VDQNRRQFRTPAILRFATDTFMDEFLNLLNTQPERLPEFVAAPETWETPPHEPDQPIVKSGLALKLFRARAAAVRRLQARGSKVIGASLASDGAKPLKLYQPVHQRFYLVATCLVCRVLGLPDRTIDAGAQERATFVLRLLQPHDAKKINPHPRDCNEFALVKGEWHAVGDPGNFVQGEEQRSLSPAVYVQDDQRRRRLLVGLIPVGDRERLLQAKQPNPAGQPPLPDLVDARLVRFETKVAGPLVALEDVAATARKAILDPNPPNLTGDQTQEAQQTRDNIRRRTEDQLQQMSWYVLLDFANFLEANLDELWQEIQSQGDGSTLSNAPLRALWNTLANTIYPPSVRLVDAIRMAHEAKDQLESEKTTYDSQGDTSRWPNFQFRFFTTDDRQDLQPPLVVDPTLPPPFSDLIEAALQTTSSRRPLPVPLIAQANANPQGPVWFTIRCVLERPNCGALTPPLVSEPTQAFQLAAYFDPDAPARPIRIGLPVDTTPAGLRKFDKNTAFVMSDTLCGQVHKMSTSATFLDLVLSVLPFPLKKDLSGGGGDACPGGGTVCSLSIPIITITALILLIIFVKLLDIIFFWMPFFQICLPLPNFSAKDSQ
jgi:hypothetical protein